MNNMRIIKWLNKIGYVTVLAGNVLTVVLLYWAFWPYNVIDVSKFEAKNTTVKAGEALITDFHFCKYKDVYPLINRKFEDGLIYQLPQVTGTHGAGCHELDVALDVPKNLPPGVYNLVQTNTYRVNPIRTVTEQFTTGPITVLK